MELLAPPLEEDIVHALDELVAVVEDLLETSSLSRVSESKPSAQASVVKPPFFSVLKLQL